MILDFLAAYYTWATSGTFWIVHVVSSVLCAYHAKRFAITWEQVIFHALGGLVFALFWQIILIPRMTTVSKLFKLR